MQDEYGLNIPNTNIFVYKNIQSNNVDSTLNATDVFTIKTNKGTIVYMLTPNSNIWTAGVKYITKPVFTSGFYLGKNIVVTMETLNDANVTRKTTIAY